MVLVVALLVIVPIVELAVFLQVAQWIGGWEALFLLLAVSVLGAWLVKAQGVAVWRQGRAEVNARRVPGRAIVDGGLVVTAGVLLVIPGFVTAIVGLLLLLPFTRRPVREYLIRRWTRNARRVIRTVQTPGGPVVTASSVVLERPSDAQQLGRGRAIEAGDEPLG